MELKNYIEKAYKYYGKEDNTLFNGPIFRMKDNNLFIGYILMENVDNKSLRRLQRWILQDIKSGDIVYDYDGISNDFTNGNELPFENIYSNNGESIIYDDYLRLLTRANLLMLNYLNELKDEKRSDLYNYNILRYEKESISVINFFTYNKLEIRKELMNVIKSYGDKLKKAFDEEEVFLFDKVIEEYKNGSIDFEAIRKYHNFVKYSYPGLIDTVNCFCNIDNTFDNSFDNELRKVVAENNAKKSGGIVIKKDYDDLLDRIDKQIEELESLKID